MIKELVTIEFRHLDAPNPEGFGEYKTKTITIGIFDDFNNAINEGNKALEALEQNFTLNPNYSTKPRFSKNGGCFGLPNRLITNIGYLQTPFEFYAKITKLEYKDINKTILEVMAATKRHKEHD